jgi:transposase
LMLKTADPLPLNDWERNVYLQLVPQDHFLRRLLEVIDFERFRGDLEACYRGDQGRPPWDPVCLLKLEILARHYQLSDRQLVQQTQVNVAFRLFVGVGLNSVLPHHTLLTYFRQRVGAERLQQIFHTLLGQARELGLVRDRLRLKDATHVIANIAIPSTLRLVAETRNQLLAALEPFAAATVEEEKQRAEAIHQASVDLPPQERLVRRVAHLKSVLAWAAEVPRQEVYRQATAALQEQLQRALAAAHKVLADREPEADDKLLSLHDPDARRGKHGDYFEGYLLDVAVDADSQLITGVNVLPGNGDEGADATYLIRQEEQAQGNDVQGLSLDGAGYRGELLRELTDSKGLDLEVFVPPPPEQVTGKFESDQFTLSDDGTTLTCPAGQTTTWRYREKHGVRFFFPEATCSDCPLRSQCLAQPTTQRRSVAKNIYEAEYRAARAKAQTEAYAEVRRQHPAIERKLSELVRWHDLRHARYRGRQRVLRQGILTALVVNLKRMMRLLRERLCQVAAPSPPTQEIVRASLIGFA